MRSMFQDCLSLIRLNIMNFNTSKVKNMSGMFCNCFSLIDLVLPEKNFITDNVLNISYMFYNCSSLEKLDISNFSISCETKYRSIFYGLNIKLLKKIRKQKELEDIAYIK